MTAVAGPASSFTALSSASPRHARSPPSRPALRSASPSEPPPTLFRHVTAHVADPRPMLHSTRESFAGGFPAPSARVDGARGGVRGHGSEDDEGDGRQRWGRGKGGVVECEMDERHVRLLACVSKQLAYVHAA